MIVHDTRVVSVAVLLPFFLRGARSREARKKLIQVQKAKSRKSIIPHTRQASWIVRDGIRGIKVEGSGSR